MTDICVCGHPKESHGDDPKHCRICDNDKLCAAYQDKPPGTKLGDLDNLKNAFDELEWRQRGQITASEMLTCRSADGKVEVDLVLGHINIGYLKLPIADVQAMIDKMLWFEELVVRQYGGDPASAALDAATIEKIRASIRADHDD